MPGTHCPRLLCLSLDTLPVPLRRGKSGGTVTIDKKEVPVGDAKDLVLNDLPIVVINRPQKGYIALSRVCTHLGCLVEYQKGAEILLCPCHGGKFNLDGSVISGPPPQPLPRLALKVEGNSLVIG